MQVDWQLRNSWNFDRDAAYAEAVRRIDRCIERQDERLYLGDVTLDRLPLALSSLTWLHDLDLYGSPIADLTPLAPLIKLQALKAGSRHSPSPELDFLAGWRELRELQLISTTLLDLAPLQACQQLSRISIYCSQPPVEFRNLDALDGLPRLKQASFHNMRADQFDTIGTWRSLKFLQLIGTDLVDLRGFDQLLNLEHLNVSGSRISDLSPLSTLPHLEHLDVSGSRVSDLSSLSTLPRLRELTLTETSVSDLAPLASLSPLEELTLARTPVCTLRPLVDLASVQRDIHAKADPYLPRRGLRRIDFSGCPIADLAPLSNFDGLEAVNLSDTPVRSVEPLQRIKALRYVTLDRTPVRTLGPRGTLSGLQILAARDTPLVDVAALEPGRSLQAIDISGTCIADLSPLRDALDCRTLTLRGSRVADLTPLLKTGSREEDHRYSRQLLDFRDTPAAHANNQLAALAALANTDCGKCFEETKQYLQAQSEAGQARVRRSLWQRLGIGKSDWNG